MEDIKTEHVFVYEVYLYFQNIYSSEVKFFDHIKLKSNNKG